MKIVALVGVDGTGKTTQARNLVAKLGVTGFRAKYVRPVFLIFDPYRLSTGRRLGLATSPRMVRLRMEESRGGKLRYGFPIATMVKIIGYFYAIVVYSYLRVFLRKEQFVVCDRYFYQYFYDVFGSGARRIALSFPRPDFVFWLDGTIELIRARIDEPPSRNGDIAYIESVVRLYRDLSQDLSFVRIDAGINRQSIANTIWQTVIERVRRCET
ncbi:MAG: hypothetical protein V3U69_05010 [Bacteroidota bacterium]